MCLPVAWILSTAVATADWPQWRGRQFDGFAGGEPGEYPIRWSDDSDSNDTSDSSDRIVWQTDLPGRGSSTPVVADGQIYVTAGIDGKNTLLAVNADDGQIRWRVALGQDAGKKHRKGGGSNPSVVIGHAGGRTIAAAYFRSGDLAGVADDGTVLWRINLHDRFAADTLWWDLGSSPILLPADVLGDEPADAPENDSVVIAVVQTGPSYVVRLDLGTGEVIWRTDRDVPAPEEAAQTYATPILTAAGDRPVIVVPGGDHITVHDPASGAMLGSLGGFNPTGHKYFRSIASPVAGGGGLLVPYARGQTLTGVDLRTLIDSARGIVADPDRQSVRWQIDSRGSDVPTPAVAGGVAYCVDDTKRRRGTVFAVDIDNGQIKWQTKLPKSRADYSASPLIAGDHLYVLREDATTFVLGPLSAPTPRLIATNPLQTTNENPTVASPIPLPPNAILLRTADGLVKIK